MKSSTLLRKARNLLQKKGWCRQHEAKDKNGTPVDPLSKTAVSFCAAGAMERVGCQDDVRTHFQEVCGDEVEYFNDNIATDKRHVIRMFNKAIKLAKQKGD